MATSDLGLSVRIRKMSFGLYFPFTTRYREKVLHTTELPLEKAKRDLENDVHTLEVDLESYRRLRIYWWALYIAAPLLYLLLTLICQ